MMENIEAGMVEEGDTAPDFTAPMVGPETADDPGEYTGDDITAFTLSDAIADGPVVLAFFPGVFSRTCTRELCQMRDWLPELGELNAQVYGVSVDSPWSQLAFINEYGLNFPLLSGFNNDVIAQFGVRRDDGLLAGIAARSVFVIAPDRRVVYKWVVYEPLVFPDFDEIEQAIEEAA